MLMNTKLSHLFELDTKFITQINIKLKKNSWISNVISMTNDCDLHTAR